MHLYELLACLALISSAFVCVVVHVTQKGYLFWCYGDTFRSRVFLSVCPSLRGGGGMGGFVRISGWLGFQLPPLPA